MWFLRMHSLSHIVHGLTKMVVATATQHQKRRNNGNIDLKGLNLRRLVESENDEYNREDDDNLEWEPNVAKDEDSDSEYSNIEGDNSDKKNEVLTEAVCGEKRKQVLQHVWTKKIKLKVIKWMAELYNLDGIEKGLSTTAVHFSTNTQYNSVLLNTNPML